jgi:hypothetical protein
MAKIHQNQQLSALIIKIERMSRHGNLDGENKSENKNKKKQNKKQTK